MERRLQAWIHRTPYHERYEFVPLSQISPDLQHAVIAAEDARFYQHHGFDWHAMEIAAEGDMEGGRIRGGSTLTQQLVKNLFFGTGRSILRKGAEFTLVPVAELVLGKQRILELYLNVVEWGPGVYGAESACRYYYRTSARNIDRQQVGPTRRNSAVAPEATARSHESLQRTHPGADAPNGLVIAALAQTSVSSERKTPARGLGLDLNRESHTRKLHRLLAGQTKFPLQAVSTTVTNDPLRRNQQVHLPRNDLSGLGHGCMLCP